VNDRETETGETTAGGGRAKDARVRRSVIAGTWYPGDPRTLRAMVDDLLGQVPTQTIEGDLVGLVSPHAGYVYSGQVAAYAYALLRGRSFSHVAVVSPVHRVYPGRFGVTVHDCYETPLGPVPVDGELLEALAHDVHVDRVSEDKEHSLEIQLPFLQTVLGQFSLLPIMMGDQDWRSCAELGRSLARIIQASRDPVLLVASTDLSHFHPYEEAVRLDRKVTDLISAYRPEALIAGRLEACGIGPVAAVMVAAESLGANKAVVLKYMNSGDVTGDRSSVVGYAAAALLRT